MNQTANSSGQVQITTAWNILVCNMGIACGYEQTGFPKGETPTNFVAPIACTSQAPGKFKQYIQIYVKCGFENVTMNNEHIHVTSFSSIRYCDLWIPLFYHNPFSSILVFQPPLNISY